MLKTDFIKLNESIPESILNIDDPELADSFSKYTEAQLDDTPLTLTNVFNFLKNETELQNIRQYRTFIIVPPQYDPENDADGLQDATIRIRVNKDNTLALEYAMINAASGQIAAQMNMTNDEVDWHVVADELTTLGDFISAWDTCCEAIDSVYFE